MKAESDASGHPGRSSSRKPVELGAAVPRADVGVDPAKLGDNPILQRWVTKAHGPRHPKQLGPVPAPAGGQVAAVPGPFRNRRRAAHTGPFDAFTQESSKAETSETWQPGSAGDRPLGFSRFVFLTPPSGTAAATEAPVAPPESPSLWVESPAAERRDTPPEPRSPWRDWWKYLIAAIGSVAVIAAIVQSTRGLWDAASQPPIAIMHRSAGPRPGQKPANAQPTVAGVEGHIPVSPAAASAVTTPATAPATASATNDFLLQGRRHLAEQRYDEARRVFEIQRAGGSAAASFELGVMDFEGWGAETNYVSAAKHYREAAEGGFLRGDYFLAAMELHGLGGATFGPDTERRLLAAARGDVTGAQVALGLLYMDGGRLARNPGDAFKWVSRAAERGDRVGQALLGMMYEGAVGVPESSIDAARWYERACVVETAPEDSSQSAGLPPAMRLASRDTLLDARTRLGLMRKTGRGVERDYGAALALLKAAAGEGYVEAEFNLGLMYHNGQGTATNHPVAVSWYRKAAEKRYPAAEFNLGVMYDSGLGVAQDSSEARLWYRRAAEQGVVRAMVNLGWMCQVGRGGDLDYAEAAKWFGKAAESGDPKAQAFLGNCYSEGKGVSMDLPEAYKWLHLSSLGGNIEAESLSTALLDRLKPQEIAEALRRAREFQKRTQPASGAN